MRLGNRNLRRSFCVLALAAASCTAPAFAAGHYYLAQEASGVSNGVANPNQDSPTGSATFSPRQIQMGVKLSL